MYLFSLNYTYNNLLSTLKSTVQFEDHQCEENDDDDGQAGF